MQRLVLLALAAGGICAGSLRAAESGDAVVVIYNSRMPDSKAVADHYAERRGVPATQVMGMDLPQTENMTRAQYRFDLERALLHRLEDQKIFLIRSEMDPPSPGNPGGSHWKVKQSGVRYVVLCYGVPLRILRDATLKEEGMDKLPEQIRRNEAAVDTELALLPLHDYKLPLTGPLRNHTYGVTNASLLHPTNGILMVTRIDGPTPAIARGLVDKAIEAEREGLWGRGYFDLRAATNANYRLGEEWIRTAANVTRSIGFETVVDEKPEVFSASFPMSQIALYAGWYEFHAAGPFARDQVEFMPGAFAYHLQSASAHSLRTDSQYWVGPFLGRGVTATMGCIDEPYLEGTPDIGVFFARFLAGGMSFGEAAYAAQMVLSWQTTIVGDPLYRPFARPALALHADLEKRQSKWLEWSHLKAINIMQNRNTPVADLVHHLETEAVTKNSAVLTEKLADLYEAQGKPSSSLQARERAIERGPSPQQEIRLRLAVAEKLVEMEKGAEATEAYRKLLQKFPDYPGQADVYRALLAIAKKGGNQAAVEEFEKEIARLSKGGK